MGFAELVLFFKSLPEIVKILGSINDSLQQIKRDSINKELDKIKEDFNKKLTVLIASRNDDERRKNLLDLYSAIK